MNFDKLSDDEIEKMRKSLEMTSQIRSLQKSREELARRPWTTADYEQLYGLLCQKTSAIMIAHVMNRPMKDIRPSIERSINNMRRARMSDVEIATRIGWKVADVNMVK